MATPAEKLAASLEVLKEFQSKVGRVGSDMLHLGLQPPAKGGVRKIS